MNAVRMVASMPSEALRASSSTPVGSKEVKPDHDGWRERLVGRMDVGRDALGCTMSAAVASKLNGTIRISGVEAGESRN